MKALTSITLLALVGPHLSAQQSIGMAYNTQAGEVLVFDADTDTPLGVVAIPSRQPCGDCEILADLSLGFVADFRGRVWVIDLTSSPPALAAGTNPIPISNSGGDVVVSPDQRYLLVAGNQPSPLSIVDIAGRAEIGTFAAATDYNSVDVAADGSILVTSFGDRNVARLSLDALGNVTDTGDRLTVGGPNNVYFSPDGAFGVTFRRVVNRVVSFTTPGLGLVDDTALQSPTPELGVAGAFDSSGERLFTMSAQFNLATGASSTVRLHDFDPATGEVADTPVWTTALPGGSRCYGTEQLALHPNDQKLYVAQLDTNEVSILDANDGSEIGTLPLRNSTGVCVRQLAECFLVVGDGSGDAAFDAGGHTWQTQLGSIASSYPVTLDEMPSFPLPDLPRRVTTVPPTKVQELDVQVLMWNPTVFPGNPEQWSNRLHVTVWSNGRVTSRPLGTRDGIEIEHEVVRRPDGSRHVRFPFAIEGM